MKPPIEYRQPRPASSSGRTPDFGSGKAGSNPAAGSRVYKPRTPFPEPNRIGTIKDVLPDGRAIVEIGPTAEQALAHKRRIKAAQMRRYRAKLKGKK